MTTVVGWFLFGMFVWLCVIVMQAIQTRLAPELNDHSGASSSNHESSFLDDLGLDGGKRRMQREIDARDEQIADLKSRIEVLERIVTDRRYHFDDELRRSSR